MKIQIKKIKAKEKITKERMEELISSGHVVFVYQNKKIVVVDGYKYYRFVDEMPD